MSPNGQHNSGTTGATCLAAVVGLACGVVVAWLAVAGASAFRGETASPSPHLDPLGAGGLVGGARAEQMGCLPNEIALVRRLTFGTEAVAMARCVALVEPAAAGRARLVSPMAASVYPESVPAGLGAARAAEPAARIVAPASRTRGRTWQKSALVIGGSTATGAGVGGLVGGKKGALIGAAIGGGASTIYEATRRH